MSECAVTFLSENDAAVLEDSASSDPTDNTADDAGAVYVYGIGK